MLASLQRCLVENPVTTALRPDAFRKHHFLSRKNFWPVLLTVSE